MRISHCFVLDMLTTFGTGRICLEAQKLQLPGRLLPIIVLFCDFLSPSSMRGKINDLGVLNVLTENEAIDRDFATK